MARWGVMCPLCNEAVPYREVPFEPGAFAWLSSKPNFPEGGLSLECPSCEKTSHYERHNLIYLA